jgi:hypothetical protein
VRPGARRNIVGQLEKLAERASSIVEEIKDSELPDLRVVGVGWGSKTGCEIDVGRTYVFKAGRDSRHIVDIIKSLAWGLFESQRDMSNPQDPVRHAEVRAILNDVADHLPGGPRWGQDKMFRCAKCDGLKHICIACDGECKVDWKVADHPRETKLCPWCSAWLAPQEPR